jgi:hypothetical protein
MACLYVAHADLARARRLIGAIPLLYERASYGDPGEMMRGLRHQMEAIVDPTWPVLTRLSMRAAKYPQRGARLWAIRQLGVLRDTAAFGTLVAALTDEAELVRAEARLALEMCCQTNESIRAGAIEALSKFVAKRRRKAEREDARKAIEAIREMK